MLNQLSNERGQILVLVVVGLIGLLGFTSLAIDGGMILSDRRFDQAAADAASFAGAGNIAEQFEALNINTKNFDCSRIDINAAKNAAIASASMNTFSINTDLSTSNGVDITCNDTEQSFAVKVMITQPVETTFAHLFYSGEIKNTVESVVEVYPMHDIGYGNTIVALHPTCANGEKDGVTIDGTNQVTIEEGGIWSNSGFYASGTSLDVDVNVGSINYFSSCPYKFNGNPVQDEDNPPITPDPIPVSTQIPTEDIGAIDCASLGESQGSITTNGDKEIGPGNYTGITVKNKDDTLFMKPGLYCLTGDLKVEGGSIIGIGVTIYMQKDGSKPTNVSIGGNAGVPEDKENLGTIQLTAPNAECKGWVCPPAIEGLLIYLAYDPDNPSNSNTGNVNLQGNDSSVFTGTIFAPAGSIDLGGTSNTTTTMGVQAIADTVKIHGTVIMKVTTDADTLFLVPASLSQTQ